MNTFGLEVVCLWIIRIYLLLLGYVDGGSPPLGSSRSWKSMEMEIQSLLEKLLDINDSMSRCAASAGPATSVTQKLARHRDILHEFTQVCLYQIPILRSSVSSFSFQFSFSSKRMNLWQCCRLERYALFVLHDTW